MDGQRTQEDGFIGRSEDLLFLARWAGAAGSAAAGSLVLTGGPGTGKTALLQRLAARLFWKQERVAPFFYPAAGAVLDAADLARDHLASFLRQRLAFELRDQNLLHRTAVSLEELEEQAGRRGSGWAGELISRFRRCTEPLLQLRMAIQAPVASAAATGRPVAVMIDDLPLLDGLCRSDPKGPSLLPLFLASVADRRTPHLLAGCSAAMAELVLPALSCMELRPLTPRESDLLLQEMLQARGLSAAEAPPALLGLLNGNPLYLRRVAMAAQAGNGDAGEMLWRAYLQEITAGGLQRYFVGKLTMLFSAPQGRRAVLEELHRLCRTGAQTTAAAPDALTPEAARRLLCSGFLQPGFSAWRAPDDGVLRDCIALLCEREFTGMPEDELLRRVLAERTDRPQDVRSWDLVVPLTPRSELVVAQSLEQIGKNLHIAEEAIGQLQMAVIEACINAIEHTRGGDRRLYASFRIFPDRLEARIESQGTDFLHGETGEPPSEPSLREGPQRGQGIRLMKRFADEVRFERTGKGTRVVLVKDLSRAAAGKEGVSHRE